MNLKRSIIISIILVMLFSLAACGGSKEASAEQSASVSAQDQQEVLDQLAKDAAAVPEPDTQAVASEASSDASSPGLEDKLLGEWADINDAARIVKITKNGEEYTYTDIDGTYSGIMADGILTIKISDAEGDTAKVFIDVKTGNLVTDYQGDIYEFTRKTQ